MSCSFGINNITGERDSVGIVLHNLERYRIDVHLCRYTSGLADMYYSINTTEVYTDGLMVFLLMYSIVEVSGNPIRTLVNVNYSKQICPSSSTEMLWQSRLALSAYANCLPIVGWDWSLSFR